MSWDCSNAECNFEVIAQPESETRRFVNELLRKMVRVSEPTLKTVDDKPARRSVRQKERQERDFKTLRKERMEFFTNEVVGASE